jgi:hypothetical protein
MTDHDIAEITAPQDSYIAELEIQLELQKNAMRQMIYAIFGRDLESDEGTEVGQMVAWIHGLRAENTKLIGAEQDAQYYKDRHTELRTALEIYANKDNWNQKDMQTGAFDWFMRGNAGWEIAEAALKNNKP